MFLVLFLPLATLDTIPYTVANVRLVMNAHEPWAKWIPHFTKHMLTYKKYYPELAKCLAEVRTLDVNSDTFIPSIIKVITVTLPTLKPKVRSCMQIELACQQKCELQLRKAKEAAANGETINMPFDFFIDNTQQVVIR